MSETPEERPDLRWAEKLVEDRAWVMHVETRTIGRVCELWDGDGKKFVPPGKEKGLEAPVLKFEQGHTFLAKAGGFVEFTEREAQFLVESQSMLAGCLADMARRGATLGVIAQTGALVMAGVLRAQLSEIQRLHPNTKPAA